MPASLPAHQRLMCLSLLVGLIVSWLFVGWPVALTRAADDDTIVYVDVDAIGANDGTSWADAYTNLRVALNGLDDTHSVWVAEGTYYTYSTLPPNLAAARTNSFIIPAGVEVYGGFAGSETSLDQRDWESKRTILSGDLERDDTLIDGIVADPSDIVGTNTRNVVAIYDGWQSDDDTIFDGFIVTGGQTTSADSAYSFYGAGMLAYNASPIVRNVIFSGNDAYYSGGGMASINSSARDNKPVLSNVTFSNNTARYSGGGLYIAKYDATYGNTPSATLNNVSFNHNNASTSSGAGGGMYITASEAELHTVSFEENTARYGGGLRSENSVLLIDQAEFIANSASNGGGLHISNSTSGDVTVTNSSFAGNSAYYGGGMANDGASPSIGNVSFSGNDATYGGGMDNSNASSPILTNVSFSGNDAEYGGGMYNYQGSSPTLINTTFNGNSADSNGGGMRNNSDSSPTIQNSVFWGNSSSVDNTNNSTPTISYSLLEGCKPSGVWDSACGSDDGNNLADSDPLFVAPIAATTAPTTTGDLQLQQLSPVIDLGDSSLNTTASDLAGNPRITGAAIDLGAYERLHYNLTTAIVGNGTIARTPDAAWYEPSSSISLTATAELGWEFTGWSGLLSSPSTSISFAITQTGVLTATFANLAPTAVAGADQSALAASSMTLDGSASFDLDPAQTLSYAWTQTSGPSVVLSDASAAQPTFTAPNSPATLTFELVVTDNYGVASAADSVTIMVSELALIQHTRYLPLIAQALPEPELTANLVITALSADAQGISLTIKNTGTLTVSDAFWVDVYINPRQVPNPNVVWQEIASAGAVWGVTQSLAPGESLTLSTGDAFYAAEYSAGSYAAGDSIYAIVDSFNPEIAVGAVTESDEGDNLLGPVHATAAGSIVEHGNAFTASDARLPARK